MLSSLFKSISKPFNTGNGQQGQSAQGAPQGQNDRVEDDFLLVGKSASERTTIYASQFHADQVDAPPGYREVNQNQGLPSYSDYNSNIRVFSPSLDVSKYPGIQYGNPMQAGSPTIQTGSSSINLAHAHENHTGMGTSDTNRTAISDIPFALGATTVPNIVLHDIRMSNLLHERTFDISNYEYDFKLEMSYLYEHGGFQGDAMDVN